MSWEQRFYAAFQAIVALERRIERAGVKPTLRQPLVRSLEQLTWEERFSVAFHAVLVLEVEAEKANKREEGRTRKNEKTARRAARFLSEGRSKWMGRIYPSLPGIRTSRAGAILQRETFTLPRQSCCIFSGSSLAAHPSLGRAAVFYCAHSFMCSVKFHPPMSRRWLHPCDVSG
jgi:hypothetical protein